MPIAARASAASRPQLRELQLQGMAEPFLHPRFLDMVRFTAARGIEASTNCVSLDAADPAAYGYIRIGSRFDRVARNLERLVRANRRLGRAEPPAGRRRFRERLASDDPPEICKGCAIYNGNF